MSTDLGLVKVQIEHCLSTRIRVACAEFLQSQRKRSGSGDLMKTYVALLRGINVGGKNSLRMKELVCLLEAIGSRNVKTYIQSGNVVFQNEEEDASRLTSRIGAEIEKRRGFEPYLLLLMPDELEKAIAGNPFPEAESEPTTLHIGFLAAQPVSPDLGKLESSRKESERFVLKDTVFYLHAPEGVGRSKLAANAERLLGVSMTDRNWRTVRVIRDMVKEIDVVGGSPSARSG